MKSKLHAIVGSIAMLTIASFWVSTVVSELFFDHAGVLAVKNAVLLAMWLLIPSMAATGASGFALARGRSGRLIEVKTRRMKLVAVNGLLLLLPCAFALQRMASVGRFDALFYSVQALELAAGAVNLILMGLNMRDGLRLSGSRLKR